MSYPDGEWIVDAWVEGPIYPIYSFQQTIVHAISMADAIVKGCKELGKASPSKPIPVSVRRIDMNYPGQTFKP